MMAFMMMVKMMQGPNKIWYLEKVKHVMSLLLLTMRMKEAENI